MPTDSLYDLLEVDSKADADTMRAAWRRLARLYHPDRNPGDPGAAERFGRLSKAWDVLGDPARRAAYDTYGDDARSAFFDEDLARQAKAQAARPAARPRPVRRPERGEDQEAVLDLTPSQALNGGVHTLMVRPDEACTRCDGTGHRRNMRPCSHCRGGVVPGIGPYRIQVPAKTSHGDVLLAPELGGGGRGGGPMGDLRITCTVFRRTVDGLVADVPVPQNTLDEGGKVRVLTPDGGAVMVRVPPDSQPGQRMRVRGKGGDGADLMVTLRPSASDEERVVQGFKVRR